MPPPPHSVHVPRSSAMENPLVWQAEQVAVLKKLAVDMGWKESSKEYKYELKRIHLQAKGEEASAGVEGVKVKMKWPPFKGWVKGSTGTFRDRDAAKVGLLCKLHAGRWVNDKSCPNSDAEEGRKATRHVNKVAVGGPYLARLVDVDGNGKKWRVDTPKWLPQDSDDEDEEEKKVDSKAKKRGASDDEEETAEEAGSSKDPPAPAPEAAPGKRQRKGRGGKQ
jgi:hypothetical protein